LLIVWFGRQPKPNYKQSKGKANTVFFQKTVWLPPKPSQIPLAVALPLRRRHSFSFTVLIFFFDFFGRFFWRFFDFFLESFFYFFGAGFGLFWATPTCLKTLWGGGVTKKIQMGYNAHK
jgi:hypothetical protein